MEHWERISEHFIEKYPESASLWNSACDGETAPDVAPIVRELLLKLRASIGEAAPLTPRVTEEILEDLPPWEHQRMLDAVAAVFAEAIARGEPCDAWVD